MSCSPPQVASKFGLRDVFVAAQKLVTFDFGHHSNRGFVADFAALGALDAAQSNGLAPAPPA